MKSEHNTLQDTDFLIGSVIAVLMLLIFVGISSGLSLIVTFCPGVAVTWCVFAWMWHKQIPLPDITSFLPAYFAVLAVQFLHFAEEFTTGFPERFPVLYGGAPYPDNIFVTFNMAAYAVFTLAPILALTKHRRFLMIPTIFFIVYGGAGNAVAHTWWSIYLYEYFPGLITAQLYWGLAPWLLFKLLGNRKAAFTVVLVMMVVLIPVLTIFIKV